MLLTVNMVKLLRDDLRYDFSTSWAWVWERLDEHLGNNMVYLGVALGFEAGPRAQHVSFTRAHAHYRVLALRDIGITVGVGTLNTSQGGSWSEGTDILKGEDIRIFVIHE